MDNHRSARECHCGFRTIRSRPPGPAALVFHLPPPPRSSACPCSARSSRSTGGPTWPPATAASSKRRVRWSASSPESSKRGSRRTWPPGKSRRHGRAVPRPRPRAGRTRAGRAAGQARRRQGGAAGGAGAEGGRTRHRPRRCVFVAAAADAGGQGDTCAQAARRHRRQARGQIPWAERRRMVRARPDAQLAGGAGGGRPRARGIPDSRLGARSRCQP